MSDLESTADDNIENTTGNNNNNTPKVLRLDPKIAAEPIYCPDNLFIAKFKDLGVDEILAAFIDPLSTTAARAIAPDATYILPFTGPIAEKGIFFIRHGLEARGIYKSTREKDRKPYNFYLKEGIKHGGQNVIKDIVYHDPIYTTFMGIGITAFPEVHPGFISIIDYAISVPMAVGVDVAVDYIRHKSTVKKMKKAGFIAEKYYESRFFVLNEKNPAEVMDQLMREFHLDYTGTATYKDTYFDIDNKGLSGRTVKMRLRQRNMREFEKKLWAQDSEDHSQEQSNMLQIIYTRARKDRTKNEQCNYYPVKKEKIYALLEPGVNSIDEIVDENIRNIAKKRLLSDNISGPLTFERTVAGNNELAVCTDKINCDRPFYVLELKVYNDTRLLREAMRYLMVECPLAAKQTTYGKADMML